MSRLYAWLLSAVLLSGAAAAAPAPAPHPRSVVLFVADGLGSSQRLLASLVQTTPLAMDTMPVVALSLPGSLDHPAPDTAAACTALATGHKTRDNLLSYDDATGQPLPTLLEVARRSGKLTGLVTNLTVTHASIAGFAAHAQKRDDEDGVASQYAVNGPDVILGGGTHHFQAASRPDGHDLLTDLTHQGYRFVQTAADLAKPGANDKLLGLFAPGALSYELDRRAANGDAADQPSLADMTRAALVHLAGGANGFVLVVNQGRLDWACHDHDPAAAEREVLALDEAVQAALEFQHGHADVLVVVVGSHETSGLAITPDFHPEAVRSARTSLELVAAAVRKDRGTYDKTLGTLLGWTDMKTEERESILQASDPGRGPGPTEPGHDPLILALGQVESSRSGTAWACVDHTATPCPLTAVGPGARTLAGQYDATEVPRRLAHLLDISL